MAEDRETEGQTTESTERIPPGSMSPEDRDDLSSGGSKGESGDEVSDLPDDADDDAKADKESKDSFPASDPPSW
jgi:hypothetical protein